MKRVLLLFLIPVGMAMAVDSVEKTEGEINSIYNPFKSEPQQNPWYYGGNIGFNFWNDYFYLSVQPLVGYKVSPKFSVGGKLSYSYISDRRFDPTFNSHNFGGSVFARYCVIPQFYLHSEFVYASFGQISVFDRQKNEWRSERVLGTFFTA